LSCSLKPLWNMVVPPGNMAGMYKFTRMSTSHFMTFWKEEDVYSAGFFADATRLENILATETFIINDRNDVTI